MGDILGDAIHELRKKILDAIDQGYEAMKFIEMAKQHHILWILNWEMHCGCIGVR